MAALIKNALIKQISKYLKNITPNQINISTLKGEGEIKDLQLDENVLMDLIELPTWLKITNATCNKANVKIPWTKLKTSPIVIALDKIDIVMEIADPLREYTTSKLNLQNLKDDKESAYSFIDRCIDAIRLNIDSVTITIKSNTFNANLNMSNIFVYSCTPNWEITNDIAYTKLKDMEKQEIILFKEISWEICRLEAYTLDTNQLDSYQNNAIKLIMNPSKIQIALKKRLTDKSLVSSTFRVLLNEIYWMANDTQLKSAIGTYNMISKLMKKSFEQKRQFVSASLNDSSPSSSSINLSSSGSSGGAGATTAGLVGNALGTKTNLDVSKVFQQSDIKETSIHLQISILNVHLYADDNYSGNKLIDGGAMQVLIKNLCFDHYPYHRPNLGTHKLWNNYNYIFDQHEDWSKMIIHEFVSKLETIIDDANIQNLKKIKQKENLSILESASVLTLSDFCIYKVTTNMSNSLNKTTTMNKKKKKINEIDDKILNDSSSEATWIPPHILRNELLKKKEFFLEQQTFNKRPFLSSNYSEFNLPKDTLFAQVFFSEFYFPQKSSTNNNQQQQSVNKQNASNNSSVANNSSNNSNYSSNSNNKDMDEYNYPLPSPQIYANFSPLLLNIDYLTLLWLNTLLLSIYREKILYDKNNQTPIAQTIKSKSKVDQNDLIHCDSFIEFIMPKLNLNIFNSINEFDHLNELNHYSDLQYPCAIELGLARIYLTNQNLIKPDDLFFNSTTSELKSDKKLSIASRRTVNSLSKSSLAFKNQNEKNYRSLNDILKVAIDTSSKMIAKNNKKLKPIKKLKLNLKTASRILNNEEIIRTRSATTSPFTKNMNQQRISLPERQSSNKFGDNFKFKYLSPCFKQLLNDENLPYINAKDLKLLNTKSQVETSTLAYNSQDGLVLKCLDKNSMTKTGSKDLWIIEFENFWIDLILSKSESNPNQASENENSSSLSSSSFQLVKNSSFKLWILNVHDFFKSSILFDDNHENVMQENENKQLNENLLNLSHQIIKIDNFDDKTIENADGFEIKRRSKPRSNSFELNFNGLNLNDSKCLKSSSMNDLNRLYSKINVIGKIEKLNIECNKSSINFLLRLVDSIDLFMKQLDIDSEQTLKYGSDLSKQDDDKTLFEVDSNQDDISVNLFLLVDKVEVDLLVIDHRQEIETKYFDRFKTEPSENIESQPVKQIFTSNEKNKEILEAHEYEESNFGTNSSLSQVNHKDKFLVQADEDSIKKEFELIDSQNDREILSEYLLHIYGLKTKNPFALNYRRPSTSSNRQQPPANLNNDSLKITEDKIRKSSMTPPLSVSYSAQSKTLMKATLNNNFENSISDLNNIDDPDSFILTTKDEKIAGDCVSIKSFEITYSSDKNSIIKDSSLTSSRSSLNISTATSINQLHLNQQQQSIIQNIEAISASSKATPQSPKSDDEILTYYQEKSSEKIKVEIIKASTQSQTQKKMKKFNIKLNKLGFYLDLNKSDDMMCALINLDSLEIENHKSKPFKTKTNSMTETSTTEKSDDILIRLRKNLNPDLVKKIDKNEINVDLLEILVENMKLKINKQSLDGLIEMIEDENELFDFLKIFKQVSSLNNNVNNNYKSQYQESSSDSSDDENLIKHKSNDINIESSPMPIDIIVRNFKLELYQIDLDKNDCNKEIRRKAVSVLINNELKINKLPNKLPSIVLTSSSSNSSKNINNYDILEVTDQGSSQLNDLNNDNYASLVYLLRQSKEENLKLNRRLNELQLKRSNNLEQSEKEKYEILIQKLSEENKKLIKAANNQINLNKSASN